MSTRPKFTISKRTKPVSRAGQPRRPRVRGAAPTAALSTAPVSQARVYKLGDPHITNGGDRCVIRHSEFIADVAGSVNFAVSSYDINPGLAATFRWLSSIAIRYERYQFRKLKFYYEPRCSTATAGTVILAIDYDCTDAAPTTKADVLSYHGKGDSSPWQACDTSLDGFIGSNRGSLFTRAGILAANLDRKTYDLGRLHVCTSGHAGTTMCGELLVDYEVELLIPQIESDLAAAGYNNVGLGGMTAAALFGTSWTESSAVDSLLDITRSSVSTVTFNQDWEGLVSFGLVGTGLAVPLTQTGTVAVTTVVTNDCTVNAAGTDAMGWFFVKAFRGQTLIPAITATTVTTSRWYFAPMSLA